MYLMIAYKFYVEYNVACVKNVIKRLDLVEYQITE